MSKPKERRTARQLEAMIAERLNVGEVLIRVYAYPARGWHATVITAPAQTSQCQVAADEIAAELHETYDLMP